MQHNVPSVSCADESDPSLLRVEQALEAIKSNLPSITNAEQIDIRSALDRVLAKDVYSHSNVPSYSNSAMDGFAVRAADIPQQTSKSLKQVTKIMAGAPYGGIIGDGQCARIMTGAKMPDGADTVIMQEKVEVSGDKIIIGPNHSRGDNVRHAGEDIAVGDMILNRGQRISAADVGLLASLGIPEVKVYRRLRVAFFTTGDELQSLGEPLKDGQIYDSNRYALFSMLGQCNVDVVDMGVVADDTQATEDAFRSAAENADILITSGGVSVGDADYVKTTLDKLGKVDFWRIAMKPGRPLAFGHINNCVFFGLPGNPVSVMVTFYQFVLPALKLMAGENFSSAPTIDVPCATPLYKNSGRMEYQRGILETNSEGQLTVRTTGAQGSHILSSMSQANCFIVLPLECGNLEAGTVVKVQPFRGLI